MKLMMVLCLMAKSIFVIQGLQVDETGNVGSKQSESKMTEELVAKISLAPPIPMRPLVYSRQAYRDAENNAKQLEEILGELRDCPAGEFRNAIESTLLQVEGTSIQNRAFANEQLFLVTKGLFEFPEKVERKSPHFKALTESTGIPIYYPEPGVVGKDDFVLASWPWSASMPKKFVLVSGIRRNSFFNYRAVHSFDYFLANFRYLGQQSDSLTSQVGEINSAELSSERCTAKLISLCEQHCAPGVPLQNFWGNLTLLKVFSPSTFEDVSNASQLPKHLADAKPDLVFRARAKIGKKKEFTIYTAVRGNITLEQIQAGVKLTDSQILACSLFEDEKELSLGKKNKGTLYFWCL